MKCPDIVLILLLVCLIGEVIPAHEAELASESTGVSEPSLLAYAEDEHHPTSTVRLELDKRRGGIGGAGRGRIGGGRIGGGAAAGAGIGAGAGAAAGAHRYHDPRRNTTSSEPASSATTSAASPTSRTSSMATHSAPRWRGVHRHHHYPNRIGCHAMRFEPVYGVSAHGHTCSKPLSARVPHALIINQVDKSQSFYSMRPVCARFRRRSRPGAHCRRRA